MDARDRLRVERALAAATKARDWAAQPPSWWDDEMRTAAIAKMVEEIGDALMSTSQGTISEELQAASPKFPWDFVRRIRITLAHHYGQVNVGALRRTIEQDVPRWIVQLQEMLRAG